MVDVTNSVQLPDSVVEFLTVIRGDLTNSENPTIPILLVFNKTDSFQHVDKSFLEGLFSV